MFSKEGLFKKIAAAHDLSCIIWEDGIFSPENMISRNTWKYDIFCVYE